MNEFLRQDGAVVGWDKVAGWGSGRVGQGGRMGQW